MFLLCLISLTSASLALSESCISQNSCRCVNSENKVVDISSVGSPDYPRFYQVFLNNTGCDNIDLYSYNPCFAFDSSDKHTVVEAGHRPCTGAAACVRKPGGSDGKFPEEHAIGLQSSAKFTIDKDNEINISYIVPESKRSLIVRLKCSESSEKNELKMVECKEESDIVLELVSKCACWDKCSSAIPAESSPTGLSVGSKLLIAFFTILLAYFVVGIFWNYCNGSHGVELIPNIEFWNDLPTLIMEGVTFTCSCCGRQSSYGEV